MSEKVTFDTAISTAFRQLQRQTLSAIPDLALLSAAFSPSPALVNKTDAIIYTAERKQKRTILLKYIARTAAAIIIVFTLLSAHPTVATAMKKIFSQTVVQWFDKYISIETQADTYPQQITDFTVGYMTDDFVLVEESQYGAGIYKLYENVNNDLVSIIVKPDMGGDLFGLDNEHSKTLEIVISGAKGIKMCSEDGYNLLIISSHGIQYTVEGFVEFDEIIKIYEKIKISL
ncbi:MAG: DUF4367 domain-containing protein [Oscillospiraceae bacterium]|nr:DUF4367 domain-containing protein [Oscillospiraceae bacterium]